MSEWDSRQHLMFRDEQTRPASDLAHGLQGRDFRSVADVGCCPGNSTQVLADLFPSTEWVKATGSWPYPSALDSASAEKFRGVLREKARALYPTVGKGRVILGFKRPFLAATR